MLLKCYTPNVSKFGKLSSGHRTGKGQFSSQCQRGAIPTNVQSTHKIVLISHANKVMFKILKASKLQQYMNQELLDVQSGFRKSTGTRDQIADTHWIIEKARESQKNIYFCFMASGPITSWQIDGATVETVADYFSGLQNHCRW